MTEELNENTDSENGAEEVETSEQETTTDDKKDELSDREKQFLARAKKAEGKLKEVKNSFEETKPEPNKTNTEQTGLTREESIFFSKHSGTPEEAETDLNLAQKIAKVEGISLLAAMEDDLYKSKVAKRQEEAQKKANSLPGSSGSQVSGGHKAKPIGKMTDEEHKEYAMKRMRGEI